MHYYFLAIAELLGLLNVLQDGQYIESKVSPTFPNFALTEKIPQLLEQSKQVGSATILKEFRAWVRAVSTN